MTQPQQADEWIAMLSLQPHPEGGFYREMYRSSGTIAAQALPAQHGGPRAYVTSIYFLLKSGACSRLHRLRSDELWYFHAGSPLTISIIDSAGMAAHHRLGADCRNGELLQCAVPAECWFGARVDEPDAFSLISCAVAPGFDFADFELGERENLLHKFPHHHDLIIALT